MKMSLELLDEQNWKWQYQGNADIYAGTVCYPKTFFLLTTTIEGIFNGKALESKFGQIFIILQISFTKRLHGPTNNIVLQTFMLGSKM